MTGVLQKKHRRPTPNNNLPPKQQAVWQVITPATLQSWVDTVRFRVLRPSLSDRLAFDGYCPGDFESTHRQQSTAATLLRFGEL